MVDKDTKVLLIYTGGTIGMVENPETGCLEPFDFSLFTTNVPEMIRLNFVVDTYVFDPLIDSSEISPDRWLEMVKVVKDNYDQYDGFVILHGTDTMAYTASALSLMIHNLTKPVILTGSQLPIGKLRTDGKENLITALEIAADKDEKGRPLVPEVCVYLQNYLMRGNRVTKISSENFSAFDSPNCRQLAEVGINIKYRTDNILKPNYLKPVDFYTRLDENVMVVKLFPGIRREAMEAIFSIPHLKGVVMETYGSGNAPSYPWLSEILSNAVKRGIVIVNVTQCLYGSVEMHRYETGQHLLNIGVTSGYDMTTEAALAKMMILFGEGKSAREVSLLMKESLRGEVTVE